MSTATTTPNPMFISDSNDPVVAQVYDQCKSWASGASPTISTVTAFVMQLMAVTQRAVAEKGKGPYKKKVVLTVLRKILENDVGWSSEADRQTILSLVETTVPSIIDASVSVARGEYDLAKQVQAVGKACCC